MKLKRVIVLSLLLIFSLGSLAFAGGQNNNRDRNRMERRDNGNRNRMDRNGNGNWRRRGGRYRRGRRRGRRRHSM